MAPLAPLDPPGYAYACAKSRDFSRSKLAELRKLREAKRPTISAIVQSKTNSVNYR